MKIKVVTRNKSNYIRETKHDIHKVSRNYDPKLHQFEVAREYQRALNAAKLERMFAKPFVACLEGHCDVVQVLMKHPKRLSLMVSGSCDGEVKVWNLAERSCVTTYNAHGSVVRALCPSRHDENQVDHSPGYFFSVDDSSNIKQWRYFWDKDTATTAKDEPLNTIISKTMICGMDSHYRKPLLLTCGDQVDLWEENRLEPLRTYKWNVDSIYSIKFNPVEQDLSVATGSDRSLVLYDIRQSDPIRKVVMALRSNSVAWNPMRGQHFTAASEDYDLYTYDMRNLSVPHTIHKDHVNAVIDLDYSPTGREFVSASYDKTLRIFPTTASGGGRSREVYHTRRMQRLTSVIWSLDAKYIVSASDEMDIRLWKANASARLTTESYRERTALEYDQKLRSKFSHHPEVKRILRHRHIPKSVVHTRHENRTMVEARRRKEQNRRDHSRPGAVPYQAEKTKQVVKEVE